MFNDGNAACNPSTGSVEPQPNKVDIGRSLLAAPVKSDGDPKDYRVLRLGNGLTALLISGYARSVEKPSNRDHHSKVKNEVLASCCVCVNVGSFSDPVPYQGMAHFLEHAVSLGSEKYPEVNGMQSFVGAKFGSWHADTGYERTRYSLQVRSSCLLPALDRLAQLLSRPLFEKEAVLRERQALDNEYYLDSASDYERVRATFRILPARGNPASKFSGGNSSTLCTGDEDDLLRELRSFHRKHYSAHRMTLALQADLPLDVLEGHVTTCFSGVSVDWSSSPDDFSGFASSNSFSDDTRLGVIYRIKSYFGASEMELKWVVPIARSSLQYRCKPMNYLCELFGGEGEGSLSGYLRARGLCDRVNAGHEEYSFFAVLTLNLVLNNACCNEDKEKEVLDAVFSYAKLLRQSGTKVETFREFQSLAECKLRLQSCDAARNVRDLCWNMQVSPSSKDYVTGHQLYLEYDRGLIEACLRHLTPDKAFIVILDSSGNFEPDVGGFSSARMPQEWLDAWHRIQPYDEFHLPPEQNPFLPRLDSLRSLPNVERTWSYPVRIGSPDDDALEVWYRPDARLCPGCHVYLRLASLSSDDSHLQFPNAESRVLLLLFETLLLQLGLGSLHAAKRAGMTCKVRADRAGLWIRVAGFAVGQQAPTLLKVLLRLVAEFSELVDRDSFDSAKFQLLKYYSHATADLGTLASQIQTSILERAYYLSSAQKCSILEDIKFEEFRSFSKSLTRCFFHCRALIQGDIGESEALAMIRQSLKPLRIVGRPSRSKRRCAAARVSDDPVGCPLPLGETCHRVGNLNPEDRNSCVLNYYRTDDGDDSQLQLMFCSPIFKEFFQAIVQTALFDELRVDKQLGYSVGCFPDAGGFNISICSPAFKFSTDYVDRSVENFLAEFGLALKRLTVPEFDEMKKNFAEAKKIADDGDVNRAGLKEEVDRNWFFVNFTPPLPAMSAAAAADPSFFCNLCESRDNVSLLNRLTIHDTCHWFDDHFIVGAKNFRKLSVRVEGNCCEPKN